MEVERCTNNDCRRPFGVREFGGQMPGTKEKEHITCPYCSHTVQRTSNGVFRTHALTPQQEAEYNAANYRNTIEQRSSSWTFTRDHRSFGNNRVSSDALSALSAWQALDARRSFVVTAGEQHDAVMTAKLITEVADDLAGDHIDAQCSKFGIMRTLAQ